MKYRNLLKAGIGALLASLLVTPVFFMSGTAHAAPQVTLKVIDGAFEPTERRINVGTQVQWFSPDCNSNPGDCSTLDHSVEGPDHSGAPSINVILHPGDYSGYFTFNSLGTYIYKDNHSNAGKVQIDVVNGSTSSPAPSATATITHTVTDSPTPRHSTNSSGGGSYTSTPTPTPSHTASPSASPTPTSTPSPTDTATATAAASAIIAESATPAGSSGNGNTVALVAILGVLGLGSAGFLIYRRTIS